MRLAPWMLAAALAGLCPTVASPQGPAVEHDQVDCVVARQFPVVSARIDPADRVARARVFFRAEGKPHWYFVEMTRQDPVFQGKLPRPRKGTARIQYYIEAVDTESASTRTPDYTPSVAGGSAECSRAMAVASTTSVPSVVVVSAPPGAPPVPAGFEATGIATAGAAGAAVAATAGAAGAGGGGLGTTALVVGGVVVAGGAAAAVALGGAAGNGSDGDGGGGNPPPQQCPGTLRIEERTATTLTVSWSGGQPFDGRYIVDSGAVPSGSPCSVQSHDRSAVVQGTTLTVTGLAPATTYAVHVHPAASACSTCTSGYNLESPLGNVVATTLGP